MPLAVSLANKKLNASADRPAFAAVAEKTLMPLAVS
jgi:hypothetical protein